MGVVAIVEAEEEGRASIGALVWVQRKNGSWWPARILASPTPNPSSRNSSNGERGKLAAKFTPVQLLGKPRSSISLNWFDLEKSNRIKAFRCGEFDDCIAKAESSQGCSSIRSLKCAYQEDAILHALQLEQQEVTRRHKRPGDEFQVAVCRAKRSRCVYLPNKSSNCLSTILDPQSIMVSPSIVRNGSSVQSGSVGGNTSSRSKGCKSFTADFWNREKDKSVTQGCGRTEMRNPDGYDERGASMNCSEQSYLSEFLKKELTAAVVEAQKWNVKGKLKVRITRKQPGLVKTRKHDREDMLSFGSSSKDDRKGKHSQSSLQDPGSQNLDSTGDGHQNRSDKMLIDVEVTGQASFRGEHVPLVSLMSRLNGRAIVGHPIDIEASESSSSEIDFLGHKLFHDDRSRKAQPAWRTWRRTPVSYLPVPHEPLNTWENSHNSHLRIKANNCLPVLELRQKPLKKCYLLNQHLVKRDDLKLAGQSCIKDRLPKSVKNGGAIVTCVPVAHIFSKLHEAVGRLQSCTAIP